jgi:hypothetical protein
VDSRRRISVPGDLGTLGIMVLSMDWLAKMCLEPLILNRLDVVMTKKPECGFLLGEQVWFYPIIALKYETAPLFSLSTVQKFKAYIAQRLSASIKTMDIEAFDCSHFAACDKK